MNRLFPQPRIAVITALGSIVVLAWVYLFSLAQNMSAMEMMDMSMSGKMPWTGTDFILMFLMWAIMMVGMMVPSATPAIMVFDKWTLSRKNSDQSYDSTGLFASGYIFAWILFSLLATLCQWALDDSGFLNSVMESKNPYLGAILLIFAGLYQLSSYKDICLTHCRNPIEFIGKYWKNGRLEAFKLGSRHGLYCIGCCWLIMGLLFFFGVMNLTWILILSLFVLLEKLIIFNRWINWTISATLIISGASLLI